MRRFLVAACVLALVVVSVRADDEKSVKDTFKGMWSELLTKYKIAKTDKEKQELLSSYADKFIELAKKDPKDEGTVDALIATIMLPLPDKKDGPKSQAIAILKKHHVKNKKLGQVLSALARSTDEASLSLIKAVFDLEDKATRAVAFSAYMNALGNVIGNSEDSKRVASARKEMTELRKLLATEFKGTKDLFIGSTMPELTSKNLEGKEVKLSDLKGKVVVIDIWATWCPPCRAMIPHSRELVKKLKDKPFVLVGVSVDEKKDTLTSFMEKNEMPWTQWWNGATGGIISELGVEYFPTIYVLDGKGVIRYKDVRDKDMDKAVEKLLAEMADKSKKEKKE